MKRITHILFFICFLISLHSKAQLKKRAVEKIRALKIAHITSKLDLTEQEAMQFWPIYNSYNKKMMELRRKRFNSIKEQIKYEAKLEDLNEAEAEAKVKNIINLEEKRYKTKKDFLAKIHGIISYKKILQLEIAELEFNRKLLRKLKNKIK